MKARTYQVFLTGETPLLMHNDNLAWADVMKSWEKDPANKKNSTKGDDRSPAWRWIGSLYHEFGKIVIPADNLMTVIRNGGAMCPTGKGQKTFKSQTQSGIVVNESAWPVEVNGKVLSFEPIKDLMHENDFEVHQKIIEDQGFMLFVKRAKIGANKHVRVRPRFDDWSCQGTVTVFDDMITDDVLQNIFTFAGAFSGLGDWRPSAPKSPGPYGKFTVAIKKV
jgi:hypothetical protein